MKIQNVLNAENNQINKIDELKMNSKLLEFNGIGTDVMKMVSFCSTKKAKSKT